MEVIDNAIQPRKYSVSRTVELRHNEDIYMVEFMNCASGEYNFAIIIYVFYSSGNHDLVELDFSYNDIKAIDYSMVSFALSQFNLNDAQQSLFLSCADVIESHWSEYFYECASFNGI